MSARTEYEAAIAARTKDAERRPWMAATLRGIQWRQGDLVQGHNSLVRAVERMRDRQADAEARADRDRGYDFGILADRLDQLTFALIHAGILPPSEAHQTVNDYADQWGSIPGCGCGHCAPDHIEDCACRECRQTAEAARRREQAEALRAFLEEDE